MTSTAARELGPYRITEPLGKGGMGEVYRAYDQRLDREVAIKVVRDDQINETTLRRLTREARAASALNHPGIITIHDLGSTSDLTYIVMELACGGSLRQFLERQGRLPVPRAIEIMRQLASALATAHSSGIAHCDLKPENVVFCGDDRSVKIVDFGLARRIRKVNVSNSSPTLSVENDLGNRFGTPAYMSPEQCRGEEGDTGTDQFSLGVIAFEMITGKNPYRRGSSLESIAAILHEPAPRMPRHVPRRLQTLIRRLLQKDPVHRFESMDSVVRELELMPPDQRTRRITLSVVLLATALIGGALLHGGSTSDSPPPPAVATSPSVDHKSIESEYLRSRYLREKFGEPDSRTIAVLESIVERDPAYAPAWASLARSYANRFFYEEPTPEWEEKAFIAVEKALALDPSLADAYVARSTLLWTRAHGFPHREALADAQHAIRLAPDSPDGYGASALILMHTGLFDQAEKDIATARRLQPSDRNWIEREAYVYYLQWQCDNALEFFERLGPSVSHARAFDCAGRTEEAEEMLEQIAATSRSDYVLSTQALFAARRGEREHALQLIEAAHRGDQGFGHRHHVDHAIAETYARLGEHEQAIEWLERTAASGFPSLRTFELDPDLAGIRDTDGYRKLSSQLTSQEDELRQIVLQRF